MNQPNPIQTKKAVSKEQIQAIRTLLYTYGESRNFDAAMGDYTSELHHLPGKYAPPHGSLLIASYEGTAAGCVALQKIGEDICEMKRMYVAPDFRGRGIGQALVDAILEEGAILGYRTMRLDTHPIMTKAQALYRRNGFCETARYNNNPIEGILFFEKSLIRQE